MNKRGQNLMAVQVGGIILAVIGFAFVLMLILRPEFFGSNQQEICHVSVLARGTSPEAAQNYLALKCNTEKICVQDDKGEGCKYSFAGENIDGIVKLENDINDAAKQIDSVSAEAMYDCWKMMGEGKLDLVNSLTKKLGVTKMNKPMCVICSRIGYDIPDSTKREKIFSSTDLGDYLQKNPISSTNPRTYLEYFTDDQVSSYDSSNVVNKVEVGENLDSACLSDSSCEGLSEEEYEMCTKQSLEECEQDSGKVIKVVQGTDIESAVVFMQIKPNDYDVVLETWGKVAVGGAAGSLLISPKWTMKGVSTAIKVAGRVPYLAVALFAGAGAYVGFNVHEGKMAAATYCGSIASPAGVAKDPKNPEKGCSVVQVVPYDANTINNLCGYIESTDSSEDSGGVFG